jgi:hypothetical protein
MLFSVWTENRATEDADRLSVVPSLHDESAERSSRKLSTSMSSPAVELTEYVVPDNKSDKSARVVKLESNGSQFPDEDMRPAVFKSTFLEICCVASLVCGQLTNVCPMALDNADSRN